MTLSFICTHPLEVKQRNAGGGSTDLIGAHCAPVFALMLAFAITPESQIFRGYHWKRNSTLISSRTLIPSRLSQKRGCGSRGSQVEFAFSMPRSGLTNWLPANSERSFFVCLTTGVCRCRSLGQRVQPFPRPSLRHDSLLFLVVRG